jgi:hypothetical protein
MTRQQAGRRLFDLTSHPLGIPDRRIESGFLPRDG